jgi:hypothetical protein
VCRRAVEAMARTSLEVADFGAGLEDGKAHAVGVTSPVPT